MIQMLFSIRFQSQLRRTRGELVSSLENTILRAAKASGAKVRVEHRSITASFDENTIGLALDILLVLEAVLGALQKAETDLYGYSCILGRDIAEDGAALIRNLPREGTTGIWCSKPLRQLLDPYAVFDAALGALPEYGRLRELKPLARPGAAKDFPYREKIQAALGQNAARSLMLMGPDFIGKREALSRFSRGLLGEFPPLIIRFGSGCAGLSCYTDALLPPIRDLIVPEKQKTLDTIGAFIFKERLEDEYTPFAVQKTGLFLRILLENYIAAAGNGGISPVILLENIHLANPAAAQVFVDTYGTLKAENTGLCLYGTCSDIPSLGIWATVFPRVLRFSPELAAPTGDLRLPRDIWEIAYGVALFRRYFPPSLLLRLFEEEGKNPAMVSLALDMLSFLGLIDCSEDPLPAIHGFFALAEKNLGAGKDLIQTMVRSRLLAWVNAGTLRPGFNLLRALADLGEVASEELVLEALLRDLIKGTSGNLMRAIEESRLADFAGTAHIPALLYMRQTLESLLRGDEGDIAAAFGNPPPPEETPSYKVQFLVLETAYRLGTHDTDKAAELIKEAMLISQNRPGGRGLAQSYRLFSLVNLAKGRLADAIDYGGFALEQAEKSGDFEEAALAAYYAAALQFIFGNISKAERLATKAEETALKAGLPLWADRIRFLRGKLLFEAGRYKESLNAFRELRRNPFGALPLAAEDTLEAWIYRAAIFCEGAGVPKPERPNTDARVFEIEASYVSGDYQKTVELSDTLLTELPDSEFLFSEQPDWRSGFSQGELLLFSPKEFRTAMISAYRALGLSRMDRSITDKTGREEARRTIERIIRNERFSGTDPNDAFYFFAYYRILGESGAAGVDRDTVVSMAYKRLQRRASRIDDTETNRSFLSRHYWNGALSRAAKEHKLI
ncbi:hypothetical protein AGMMS49942_11230 [Spirochaetia bacterium]|nr:hypothetical protein AGMMS49942_11230 [Spirochaetia bacterium]